MEDVLGRPRINDPIYSTERNQQRQRLHTATIGNDLSDPFVPGTIPHLLLL